MVLAERGGVMMSLINITLAFALILGGQGSPTAKPSRSVRVGDFLVTATRVWLPSSDKGVVYRDRDHLVAVEVTVRNVSERVSQINFSPSLKVKPYAEYPWYPWTPPCQHRLKREPISSL
jgi:hypothetical protein